MQDNGNINGEGMGNEELHDVIHISGMYQNWFMDYASYVILERAVPAIEDGFKPVHRRILHAMKEMDDGRFNKVANIIGQTMQYHPHGDASIGDAIVALGQKELLIETQGNWGDVRTGDSAAAPRYIEARLSKFALDVVFNPQTTEWQLSYDGRKREPVTLPVKFPLLIAQGVDGIAVGLSTKILPHNFVELIESSIAILQGRKFELYPDFPTGGMIDVSDYNKGARGGRVRIRARIEEYDKKTLIIKDIPYGVTTTGLIESIIKANDKGKIKIRKVVDNTARDVEILVSLAPNQSPDITIDALYAFTDCEVAISPNACVIIDEKPRFLDVHEILEISTRQTVALLKRELEIKRDELLEKILFSSLEKIFIENRIYRDIEECETWEAVIETIDKGLEPYKSQLYRVITGEDIVRLTEIRIKRISKFDLEKAQQLLESLEEKIAETKHHLEHLVDYAIDYFKELKKKYGRGRERRSEIKIFDDIEATKVVIRNTKLYVNREEGFVGTSLKRDEYVTDCSDIDDIIVFTQNGEMMVTKVDSKVFVGKNIIHVAVFKKRDRRTVYNMIYRDGKGGASYIKRFNVTSITRDRLYPLAGNNPAAQVLYFSANPNGEAEVVTVLLRQSGSIKKLKWDLDFADVLIKGRDTKGNLVTKYSVKRIELKEKGVSTLKPRKIWFDDIVGRLNVDGRGELLGDFKGDDLLLVIDQKGKVKTMAPDLLSRFDDSMIVLEKWIPNKPISAVHYDGEKDRYFLKRFLVETPLREETLISEHPKSFLELVSTQWRPVLELEFAKPRGKEAKPNQKVDVESFISIKGIKAMGNQLSPDKLKNINILEPLPYEEPEQTKVEDMEVVDEQSLGHSDDRSGPKNNSSEQTSLF